MRMGTGGLASFFSLLCHVLLGKTAISAGCGGGSRQAHLLNAPNLPLPHTPIHMCSRLALHAQLPCTACGQRQPVLQALTLYCSMLQSVQLIPKAVNIHPVGAGGASSDSGAYGGADFPHA